MRFFWHHFFGIVGIFNILLGIADNLPFNFWAGLVGFMLEALFPPSRNP